jgi:uncharacterized repeat protein (TIGR02543 family)
MIKELKKLCVCFFICIFFCLSCKTEVTKYIQSESEHTSIVWKGSFASADEIENPQYLWAYYNTTDGCSYIYDGEKWTLLTAAGKNGADGLDGQNGTDGTNGTDGSNGTNGKNARVVILYVLNGGILPESAPSIYSYGTPVELEEPVFEPYNFEGFYYEADFSGKKVTSLDDDYAYGKVLYARWGYKITFDDNYTGGALNTLEYYDIDSVNNSFNTPVRTGYTFLGWYNNPNYDEQIDCWNTNDNKGNVTLYAKWKINEYTITYKDDYGLSPEPVKVEYNTILDKTYFPDLSNDDYRFIEWKTDDSTVGPGYVITDDVVFTAVIESLIFKVTFIGESTSYIIGTLRNNVEKTWTFKAHLGDSLNASELVKSVFDDIGISDYEIGDYGWGYYYDKNFQIFIFGDKSIVDDNFITSDTNFSVLTVPSMYFGYEIYYTTTDVIDCYVGLSASETTVRDLYDEELLWIPGYPYGSFNYGIGASVFLDEIECDIWQAWDIDESESSFFQLGQPFTDPMNTYWKHLFLSYRISLSEFENGPKKCYGVTYGGEHWFLIPKQKDDKLIPLKEDIFGGGGGLDPDSIPEGYYYDVTFP